MKHREVEYYYKEWITYSGAQASGYACNDVELLKGLQTIQFASPTKEGIITKIDDYIDQRSEKLNLQELNNKAAGEFYATLEYKSD